MLSTKHKRIFVSIALATYNGERFLREQLDSLLSQTYVNFEIVITDDGSTDGTCEILNEYAMADKRISWKRNTRARGFINNFTEAILLCKGDILFLCDQDDIWLPEKISEHLHQYENTSVMWVYNEVSLIDDLGKHIGYMNDSLVDYYEASRRKLLNYVWGSCILGCATSYRTSILKDIFPADKYAPGHDSWIQLAIWPAKPGVIRKVLQKYRLHNNNASGFKLLYTENETKALEVRAIVENLRYLHSLMHNNKLSYWKRLFFGVVYYAKRIRSKFRLIIKK